MAFIVPLRAGTHIVLQGVSDGLVRHRARKALRPGLLAQVLCKLPPQGLPHLTPQTALPTR